MTDHLGILDHLRSDSAGGVVMSIRAAYTYYRHFDENFVIIIYSRLGDVTHLDFFYAG